MFNPKVMTSPWQTVVNAIDSKDPIYRLLLDRYNAKVQSVKHQDKRTNTLALIEQTNAITKKPYTREIEYDRLDIGAWIAANTTVYTDKFDIKRRSLISGSVNTSSVNVDIPTLTNVLYQNHGIFISEADLTYGQDKSFKPVDTAYGMAYYLLNCTTYGDLVTYIGGNTLISHLNIGRANQSTSDSLILPGFSITRDQANDEVLQLKLPKLGDVDDWTVMFESVNNLTDKSAGVFWLKIELSADGSQWRVIDATGTTALLDATIVNTVTIVRSENVILLSGTVPSGESSTFDFEISEPIDDYILQRVTAYSKNPYATTLQFEMTSDGESIPVNDPESDLLQNHPIDLVKNNTILAHVNSNALTGRVDMPITLTDLIAVNYKEHARDTYKASTSVKYKYGVIDRVTTITHDEMVKGEITIPNLPELIRTGKFNKITFNGYSRINNGYDHGVWTFELKSVDLEASTMSIIIRERNELPLTIDALPIPVTNEFKYEVCADYMKFDLGDDSWYVSDHTGTNIVGNGPIKQQNVAVGLYLNTEMMLPELTYTKTIEEYQRG